MTLLKVLNAKDRANTNVDETSCVIPLTLADFLTIRGMVHVIFMAYGFKVCMHVGTV